MDKTNLPTALTTIQKGQMLYVNHTTKVAYAVKSAVVYETYTGTATSIKVNKNSLFKVGDFIAHGSDAIDITAIDTTTSTLYDALTLSAQLSSGNIAADEILFQATSGGDLTAVYTPNALNYFEVTPLTGTPAVTALGRAYEIKTALMPNGINAAQIAALGTRFMFI